MKIHYLDWAEKIRKKYSQIGEYGFAGATLTFLQGEKHSEPQNRGEERRLMLFFQNLIFCWENSIGVKLSIGNERVLEKSVRLALETAIQKLTSEEKTHFSREVKIARELLEGKEKTEIQMQKSLVFRRWQEGYSWEEISGHREIREYAERLEETRNRRQELARIRNREIASIQSRADARIQSKRMEFAQIQNMKEVQNTEEARIQNQHMRQHPGMELRINEAKGSLLEKMQDQSNLVHREANETLGEREVRLNKTESHLETVRLEKREQESRLETIRLEKREQASRLETIRLEKREQESQLETIRLEKRERESRMEIPSEKVQPEPRDTQTELQKMQTELNRQQEKLTETQIQLEKEAQILKHPENSLVHLEPEQKPEHPRSSLVYLEPEQKPEHPESSLLHRESKKAPDESGVQDRAKIQALEQEQEKKLSVRAEADRLEIEKERVRKERQNQLETESRLERAIERQNRSEAESRLERATERQNRSEAENRLERTTEWQNQDGEDISVDSKPFGEELTAEPAGMEEFEHPESSLVYLESKETSDETGVQPRAEKRLELESSSEKAQPEPRDTQTELQKMQTELNRQQEKLTETQIQLEKETQMLKHPENSLLHLEPVQKPERPESSLVHLEPAQMPDHPESSLLHRESKKAPDESGVQDRAKIQALEQEQEKKLSVRAEADRLEIEKERVRTERQKQLETESRLERAAERQNRSEAENRLERAIERQNRSEAESRLESTTERQNRSEAERHLESTTEWQNQDGEDISVDSKPFGEELTAEPAGMEEFEHPESSLVYLESKETSDGTGIQPRAEKRLELESSSEKAQPEPRDTQTELQKMQTELNRQQEKLTETQIQLEKEAQILKHPENSLVHLEPEQKPEHPESSLLHRKSNKAPDESRQDKAKILLNNLSESASQRKKQPENRLVPGAVERIEKNVKTMEKVLERFRVVTETRKSVFSEPHIVEKHSNVRLEKLVSETLQQKQEKIRTAALQQNLRVRTIKRIIPRLEVLPGNREMRLEILETAEKTSGYEAGQEFISLPELSTTAKIQYTVPESRKTDRTNVGSEVSAISATLTQTREETRILRKNTGYTRTALIEQEKKIDGIRKELNTQMKQVNEEVRRLMDTQRRDMSVQNLAGKVMKELQRQFRTEKIRRGY